jgi:hypothetical protein
VLDDLLDNADLDERVNRVLAADDATLAVRIPSILLLTDAMTFPFESINWIRGPLV